MRGTSDLSVKKNLTNAAKNATDLLQVVIQLTSSLQLANKLLLLVKIKLVTICHLQNCYNLLTQLSESLSRLVNAWLLLGPFMFKL